MLTLAYLFTERVQMPGCPPSTTLLEWTGKAVARGGSIVSLVGIYLMVS